MRKGLSWIALLGVGLLALPVRAQPPVDGGPGGDPPRDPAMRQKLLDTFDTNKDGKIDQAERQAMRRAMWENFGPGGPDGRGPEGRGPEGRGPEGRRRPDGPPPPRFDDRRGPEGRRGPDDRGPDGRGPNDRGPERRGPDDRGPGDRGPDGQRGPGGPDGPPPPPNPERLFNRFDENQDKSLSLDEFKKLTDFIREHRPHPPWMHAAWERGDRRGPDGPPRGDSDRRGPGGPDGRRGWWRHGPPGPPPRPGDPPGPPPVDGPAPADGHSSDAPPIEDAV